MSPGVRWVSASLILSIFSSGSIETVFYALVWSSPLPMIHEFGVFMYSKDPCVLFYLLTFIFVLFECSNFSIVCSSHNILSSLWSSLSMSASMKFCVWFIEIFISIIWSVLFPSWLPHFCGIVTISSSCSLGSTFMSLFLSSFVSVNALVLSNCLGFHLIHSILFCFVWDRVSL